MSRPSTILIVVCLIICVSTCSKLAYEPIKQDQGVTTIPDPTPAIEKIAVSNRQGIDVIMDHTTGCQYIQTQRGIYPRMNADGTQYCIGNLEEPINE